jgi:hypothetical protein
VMAVVGTLMWIGLGAVAVVLAAVSMVGFV